MTVHALALGINTYRAPIPSLLCCERDARELTGVFKEGFGFKAHYLEERKTEDVFQRIEALGKRLKPGDTFVFYFSGHGKAHKDDHYLLLPGAQLEAFESGSVVGIGVLSYRHLKFLTSGSDWKGIHRLFIIDACRAPLVQAKAGELPACDAEYLLRLPRPAADAFADPTDEGLTLLNSCALGACAVELPEKGQDSSDTGHGLFTASLLELLRKARSSARDLVIDTKFAGALGETMTGLAKRSRLPESVLHQPVLVGEGVRLSAGNVVEEVDDDETDWAIAKAKGTVEALVAYVRQKRPGKHRAEALRLIGEGSTGFESALLSLKPKGKPIWKKGALVLGLLGAIGVIVGVLAQGEKDQPARAPLSVFSDKLSDGSLGPQMVVIPAGEFEMGSGDVLCESYDCEEASKWFMPAHPVRIVSGFALGKTEITHREWRQVMKSEPTGPDDVSAVAWAAVTGRPADLSFKGCDDCPVERVSWNDAQEYIQKLNLLTGQNYRLPSESEWEYAAKAGESYKYAGADDIGVVAWYGKNSGGKTHPVAQKKANAWGLYDMSGNVSEWVEDCWHDSYEGGLPANQAPRVDNGNCRSRTTRGGYWRSGIESLRAEFRIPVSQTTRSHDIGFRLARILPEPTKP